MLAVLEPKVKLCFCFSGFKFLICRQAILQCLRNRYIYKALAYQKVHWQQRDIIIGSTWRSWQFPYCWCRVLTHSIRLGLIPHQKGREIQCRLSGRGGGEVRKNLWNKRPKINSVATTHKGWEQQNKQSPGQSLLQHRIPSLRMMVDKWRMSMKERGRKKKKLAKRE